MRRNESLPERSPFLQFRGFLPEFSGGFTMLGGLLFMRDRFSNPASSQTQDDFSFFS